MSLFYKIYHHIVHPIRSNRIIHRCLFGYYPWKGSEIHGEYWDWTTLVLKKALWRYIGVETSFLDMGTGSVGCLAIYASMRIGCKEIYAIDYIKEIIYSAERCAEPYNLPVTFYCSNLFEDVQGFFDIIAFNAPYIDLEKGKELGILKDGRSEMRFSGGKGGGETITRFLQAAQDYLSDTGILLLGVSHYHITQASVQELISSSVFKLRERINCLYIPSTVYVLTKQ